MPTPIANREAERLHPIPVLARPHSGSLCDLAVSHCKMDLDHHRMAHWANKDVPPDDDLEPAVLHRSVVVDVTNGPGDAMVVPETMNLDWDKIDRYSRQLDETIARIGGSSLGATTPKCSEALAPEASPGANEPVDGLVAETPETGSPTPRVRQSQVDLLQCVQDMRREVSELFGMGAEMTEADLTAGNRKPVRSAIGAEKSPSARENQKPVSEAPKGPFHEVPREGQKGVLGPEC